MPNPNISELLTTAIESRTGKIADNISNNNAFLRRAKERGRIKPVSGGVTIRQELSYASNGTAGYYSGYDVIDITPQDVLSSAEFSYKQASTAVTISGLEELQNSGKEQIIDLLEARMEVAEQSLENLIATGLYSDGTGSGGKQIGGLQLLVPDDPTTGTAGGINRANFSFWRSISYDATTDGGAAATIANIQTYMNAVYVQLVRGTDSPDLILSDNNYYKLYLGSLQTIQRIASDSMAQAGFVSLKYMNSDVVLDGGVGGGVPTNHMYFLNTKYLFFRPHAKRNFVPLSPDRFAVNQDAYVKLIGWAGNMTASNLRLQGLLKD